MPGKPRTRTPEYCAWIGMRRRCNSPKNRDYPQWGGRGITICREWDSYETFLRDMGPRPSPKHSLDRKDNNGPYAKWNCRWATRTEQNENRRDAVVVTYQGREMPLRDASELSGIPKATLHSRRHRGVSNEDLFKPTLWKGGPMTDRHVRGHAGSSRRTRWLTPA